MTAVIVVIILMLGGFGCGARLRLSMALSGLLLRALVLRFWTIPGLLGTLDIAARGDSRSDHCHCSPLQPHYQPP